LNMKLKIFEEEKLKRVSDEFDYEHFVTKNSFEMDMLSDEESEESFLG